MTNEVERQRVRGGTIPHLGRYSATHGGDVRWSREDQVAEMVEKADRTQAEAGHHRGDAVGEPLTDFERKVTSRKEFGHTIGRYPTARR